MHQNFSLATIISPTLDWKETFFFIPFAAQTSHHFILFIALSFLPSPPSAQKKRSILSSDDEGSDDEREADGDSPRAPTSAGGDAAARSGHSDDSIIVVPDSQVSFLLNCTSVLNSSSIPHPSPCSFFVFTLSNAHHDTVFHLKRLPISLFLPSTLNSALSVSAAPQFTCQVRSGRFHILCKVFSNTLVSKEIAQKRRLTKGSGSLNCFHSHFQVFRFMHCCFPFHYDVHTHK